MNTIFCLLLFFSTKNITVVDAESNQPIPFVSFIGLNDHKGGYADEHGKIYVEGNLSQPFVISCVGYATDTVYFDKDIIPMKAQTIVLPSVQVTAQASKLTTQTLGFFKKNSWVSFAAQAKYEFYTFIANPDTSHQWYIKTIKIALRGYSKKKFESFKIRPHVKDVFKRKPHHELLPHDLTVDVLKGKHAVLINLTQPIVLPKTGCFIGFETVGYTVKPNQFIPYSDYTPQPNDESVQISIPLIKAPTLSLWRNKNAKNWLGSPSDTYNAFAFGLEVFPDF